ncbi:hydroxyacylglutathione hydrolase family protein [Desulfobacter curvatus]|uniref:hydroxyacylglutathione hydrolase family protein n=1 Tax=Desulfobacter curvatus TaxID=2290 RepID=UPI00037EB05A|nr:hydroxyacylglutathione hydrolase family protein [Desulfobacter curvatus]
MDIQQFKYGADNLGYLVYSENCAIAIDPGAPDKMAKFASEKNISIEIVTNTHTHADHTQGNNALVKRTNARFIDCTTFSHGQVLDLKDATGLEVISTPGHTMDSLCFKGDRFVVTGDTLFNATVGNCFSGDLESFFKSLKQLMALPGDTLVYAGHDYVLDSLKYAKIIEPDNPDLNWYADAYNPDHVVSRLSDELKVNPYLRFDTSSMIERLKDKNLPRETQFQRFSSVMEVF